MIAATLRSLMIALLSLLLAGQQLACACVSHHAAAAVEATAHHDHDAHAHHATHSAAPEKTPPPAPDCEHCDHATLTAAADIDIDATARAQSAPSASPILIASELAWRLPAKSRERPPPSDPPPPLPPLLGKTRLLI